MNKTLNNKNVLSKEHDLSESTCENTQTGKQVEQLQPNRASCPALPNEAQTSSNLNEHSDSKELGRRGEKAAARFLKRRGYEILETNWTCFAGEADIIARDGDTLCFIEVKTRSQVNKGFPSEAVDARKREKYERIAACYLKDYDICDIRVRFDVISILVLSKDRAFLRFHINAFGAEV